MNLFGRCLHGRIFKNISNNVKLFMCRRKLYGEYETVTRIWNFLEHSKWMSGRLSKGFATVATSAHGAARARREWSNSFRGVKPTYSVSAMNFECTEIDPLPSHVWEFPNAQLN